MKRLFLLFLLLPGVFTSVAQINSDRVIIIGRNALYYEDYILAIRYFNQVIKVKPWLDLPYFYRAYAKLLLDDYSGAEDDSNLALQQNPFLIRAYYARGIARHSQGKYDLAIEDYRKGLELRPKERPMMRNLAIAYIQKKDYEKAKEHFNELITMFPKEADNYLARGSLYLETGDSIAALADYNKAIELDPYFAPIYGNRAILFFQQDDFQKALSDLNEAIRLSPREEGYYINRGLVRYKLNDLRGAMSDYDHVITMNSNNLIARFNRGLLRFQVGDNNRAIEDFSTVITIEPENYMAYYNRALLLSSIGSYEEAIHDFDVIIEQYPNFLPGYYNRSVAKRQVNDIAGAEEDYWYAMELERTNGNLTTQIGQTNTHPDDSEKTDDNENDQKNTREESDKNINKFNQLVVNNKEDEQKSKYQSEIRGRVQDRNIIINIEPQFILTYYEKTGLLNESINYSRVLSAFNDRAILRWKLIITNQEASLNDFQINTHFESINDFSAKIEENEKNADYYFGRGIDFMLTKNYTEAITNFDQTILLDPSYTLAYFNRAAVRYKQYDFELSNTPQDDFLETINISSGVNRNLGTTPAPVTSQRDSRSYLFEMIIRDYTTVIQQDPSFTYAYFNRANLRCIQKDFRASIPDYSEAIRRNPEFAEAYFNRGLARLYQGETSNEETLSGIADLSKAGELGISKAYNIIKRMTVSN